MRYDSVGNEYARMLMEAIKPGLVLAGHMHLSYGNKLRVNGDNIQFRALANVASGLDSTAVFRVRDGEIQEVTAPS